MIVLLAILMGLGVLFGTEALVVDLGYGMGQQGVMQNSADSAALSAAKVLAANVASSSPSVLYLATDAQVHSAAIQFATYNREGAFADATYATAVEYWKWAGSACSAPATPIFTASSDSAIVSANHGTRNAQTSVPADTCAVKVFASVTYPAMFAIVPPIGASTESASASATARVYPTTPDTTFSDVWPITRWTGASGCTYTVNSAPCSFWDPNTGGPNGNFKEIVDLSRYSEIGYPGNKRAQHIVDYDHTYPGNNGLNTDVGNWAAQGWQGKLQVGDARCSAGGVAILQFANCTNSRVEVYGGDHGSNVAGPLKTFIQNHPEGTDTSAQHLGRYITAHVFLWKYGESGITSSNDVATTLWTSGSGSSIQRVILDQMRCFRFYENSVSGSGISGYYVSCPSSQPPTNGPPSAVANTVALIS